MDFAILRIKKMNNMGSIGGKDSHELRQRETLNADPERTQLNRQVIGTVNLADLAGRVEMLPFLHEQAVSITAHRFGTPNHLTDELV